MASLFKSTLNTRALPTGDNRFIRSDYPGKLTDKEVEWLYQNNITTVVDLREEKEYSEKPCRLEAEEGFTYYHLPVTGGGDAPASPDEVEASYLRMIDEQMEKIIATIMNADSNCMYFCTAGKDRTGVVSAIILKKLGYSDRVIIDDYMETKDNLSELLNEYVTKHPEVDIKTIIPNEDNIKKVLKQLSPRKRTNIISLELFTESTHEYLKHDEIINFDDPAVSELAETLFEAANNEVDFIRRAYEYVRDNISHSADINVDEVTCTASEVLKAGHGICFAKSHLLAAILRCKNVPAGFCYQKLILDDETAPVLIYHGLNGIYIRSIGKWIRLDARGNKENVNAQFSIEGEQLAFPLRYEKGEKDGTTIYPSPDVNIIEALRKNTHRSELWKDLPTKLKYDLGRNDHDD